MRLFITLLLIIISLSAGAALSYLYLPREAKTNVYTFELPEEIASKEDVVFSYGEAKSLSNADFFKKTKQTFIDNKTSFIEADLTTMIVRVYKDGISVKEVPIKTKGKDGLWWQTPAGLYTIESKAKSHYSSFGHVYQPWSMAFQGNFFIHGWPEYKNGEPVSSQFSGGCIRLSTEDAKAVYDLVAIGYPVLVYEKAFEGDAYNYIEKEPEISAESYLVADVKSNTLLFTKAATTTKSIASITKLVTALTAAEYINLDKSLTVRESSLASTSVKRLKAGESYTAYSLLFPLLLESSNEAGEVLASSLGRSYFISLMNKKAKAIGMEQTTLSDPSGREAANVSTSEDLFSLIKYLYVNRKFVLHLTSETLRGSAYENSFVSLGNFNLYKGDDEFVGGKIGKSTSAKETYAGVFEIPIGNEVRPIAIVVLGSEDIKKDIDSLRALIQEKYGAE